MYVLLSRHGKDETYKAGLYGASDLTNLMSLNRCVKSVLDEALENQLKRLEKLVDDLN